MNYWHDHSITLNMKNCCHIPGQEAISGCVLHQPGLVQPEAEAVGAGVPGLPHCPRDRPHPCQGSLLPGPGTARDGQL